MANASQPPESDEPKGATQEEAILPKEVQEVVDWIDANWQGQQACPISGHKNWWVSTDMALLDVATPDKEPMAYPLVMLVCEGCGYTMFFNAMIAKISKQESAGGEHGK